MLQYHRFVLGITKIGMLIVVVVLLLTSRTNSYLLSRSNVLINNKVIPHRLCALRNNLLGPYFATTTLPIVTFQPKRKHQNQQYYYYYSMKQDDDYPTNKNDDVTSLSNRSTSNDTTTNTNVTILYQNEYCLVVSKPPAVVCHHSEWTGLRNNKDDVEEPEIPMLQRVRDTLGGRYVNLVHRLDRGASGCLLMTYSDGSTIESNLLDDEPNSFADILNKNNNPTAILSDVLASDRAQKTYLAIVRGEGMLHGRNLTNDGWFVIDRPIKNERGIIKNATTWFRFIAGQDSFKRNPMDGSITTEIDPTKPRASIVLARPLTGRWHQIRRHLNGLSHPILGDSSHGDTRTNREWRTHRGLSNERTCLHLLKLDISAIPVICPKGIKVTCDLPPDMMNLLRQQLPDLLRRAEPILLQEGISLSCNTESHSVQRRLRAVAISNQ